MAQAKSPTVTAAPEAEPEPAPKAIELVHPLELIPRDARRVLVIDDPRRQSQHWDYDRIVARFPALYPRHAPKYSPSLARMAWTMSQGFELESTAPWRAALGLDQHESGLFWRMALGLDPLDSAALEAAGIDPSHPLATVSLSREYLAESMAGREGEGRRGHQWLLAAATGLAVAAVGWSPR